MQILLQMDLYAWLIVVEGRGAIGSARDLFGAVRRVRYLFLGGKFSHGFVEDRTCNRDLLQQSTWILEEARRAHGQARLYFEEPLENAVRAGKAGTRPSLVRDGLLTLMSSGPGKGDLFWEIGTGLTTGNFGGHSIRVTKHFSGISPLFR